MVPSSWHNHCECSPVSFDELAEHLRLDQAIHHCPLLLLLLIIIELIWPS